MVAALTAMIVITCPHCGTRYQLPPETIGKGRKVACAHCGETWLAEAMRPPRETPKPVLREVPRSPRPESVSRPERPERPEPNRLFDDADERKADTAFETEGDGIEDKGALPSGEAPGKPEILRSIASITEAIAPWLHRGATDGGGTAHKDTQAGLPAATRNSVRARLNQITAALPAARTRRVIRLVAVAMVLITLSLLVLMRTEIVRAVPSLAGAYKMVGLEVNVIGLDFADVSTIKSRRGKTDVLMITATIYGVEPRTLPVPPVLVTLYDADNVQVYQWSAATREPDIAPGETVHFATELASPPPGAVRAELHFDEAALKHADKMMPPDAAGTTEPGSTDMPAPKATEEDATHHG